MIPDQSGGAGLEATVRDSRRRGRSNKWHKEDAKRYPREERLFRRDVPQLIRNWIAAGYAPEAGMLSVQDSIITIGSCFARELRDCFRDIGCSFGDFPPLFSATNTFAIVDFISWCVTGEEIGRGYRYDLTKDKEIREWTPEAERQDYLQGMRKAGAFVLGFGTSEVWEDRETRAVFWRGVPKDVYQSGRHEFRLTTVEENEENLLRIVELIRSVNDTAPIVLMLSPIPNPLTFREIAGIPADCVSKSVLRVAFDRVLSRRLEGVYYWPSFEVVRWAGAHVPWGAYGTDDGDPRRITHYLVAESIDAFVDAFYTPEALAELLGARSGRRVSSPGSLRGRFEYSLRQLAGRRRRAASHTSQTRALPR
jgi:hypothetical protein